MRNNGLPDEDMAIVAEFVRKLLELDKRHNDRYHSEMIESATKNTKDKYTIYDIPDIMEEYHQFRDEQVIKAANEINLLMNEYDTKMALACFDIERQQTIEVYKFPFGMYSIIRNHKGKNKGRIAIYEGLSNEVRKCMLYKKNGRYDFADIRKFNSPSKIA